MSEFLSDAARILAPPGDPPAALQRLARAAVPAFADFCLIFLLDRSGIRCVASAHATREGVGLLRRLNRVYRITIDNPVSTVALALRTGRPQLRSDIASENHRPASGPEVCALHQQLGCRSAVVVPIGAPPRVLGAISLSYSLSARQYAAQNIETGRHVAALVERFLRDHAAPPHAMGRRQVRLRARA